MYKIKLWKKEERPVGKIKNEAKIKNKSLNKKRSGNTARIDKSDNIFDNSFFDKSKITSTLHTYTLCASFLQNFVMIR